MMLYYNKKSCKIAVWQEVYGSVWQTQRLVKREFEINLAPTQRTLYAIHRKFMATGSVRVGNRPGFSGRVRVRA